MTGYAMWLAGIILQTARIYSGAPGTCLAGGLQSGRTANLTGAQYKCRLYRIIKRKEQAPCDDIRRIP